MGFSRRSIDLLWKLVGHSLRAEKREIRTDIDRRLGAELCRTSAITIADRLVTYARSEMGPSPTNIGGMLYTIREQSGRKSGRLVVAVHSDKVTMIIVPSK